MHHTISTNSHNYTHWRHKFNVFDITNHNKWTTVNWITNNCIPITLPHKTYCHQSLHFALPMWTYIILIQWFWNLHHLMSLHHNAVFIQQHPYQQVNMKVLQRHIPLEAPCRHVTGSLHVRYVFLKAGRERVRVNTKQTASDHSPQM